MNMASATSLLPIVPSVYIACIYCTLHRMHILHQSIFSHVFDRVISNLQYFVLSWRGAFCNSARQSRVRTNSSPFHWLLRSFNRCSSTCRRICAAGSVAHSLYVDDVRLRCSNGLSCSATRVCHCTALARASWSSAE